MTQTVTLPKLTLVTFHHPETGATRETYDHDVLGDMVAWSLNNKTTAFVQTHAKTISELVLSQEEASKVLARRKEMKLEERREIAAWRDRKRTSP